MEIVKVSLSGVPSHPLSLTFNTSQLLILEMKSQHMQQRHKLASLHSILEHELLLRNHFVEENGTGIQRMQAK